MEDLTGLTTGVYVLTMQDASGCSVVLTPINLTSTTAASEPDLLVNVQLIPNPTFNRFRLEMPEVQLSAAEIFDMQGQMVMNVQITDLRNQVEVSMLASGMYYLRLVGANGKTRAIKFVKQD
jgi:hypothetical protein